MLCSSLTHRDGEKERRMVLIKYWHCSVSRGSSRTCGRVLGSAALDSAPSPAQNSLRFLCAEQGLARKLLLTAEGIWNSLSPVNCLELLWLSLCCVSPSLSLCPGPVQLVMETPGAPGSSSLSLLLLTCVCPLLLPGGSQSPSSVFPSSSDCSFPCLLPGFPLLSVDLSMLFPTTKSISSCRGNFLKC